MTNEELEQRVKHFAAALERYGQHDKDCLWATPLPTGEGCWGCTCGFGNAALDAEAPLLKAAMLWVSDLELSGTPDDCDNKERGG